MYSPCIEPCVGQVRSDPTALGIPVYSIAGTRLEAGPGVLLLDKALSYRGIPGTGHKKKNGRHEETRTVPELLIEAQSRVPVQHHRLEPEQLSHRFVNQELVFSQNFKFGILGQ